MPTDRVFYISRCAPDLGAATVRRIVGSAQVKNRRQDLTGLLVYTGAHFAQVLEGRGAQVDELLARIAADPLHHGMQVVLRERNVERRFAAWSMHLVDSFEAADQLEALFAQDTQGLAARAHALLDRLEAEVRWRNVSDEVPGRTT